MGGEHFRERAQRTLCDVLVQGPSRPRVSRVTVCGCFPRNGDFDLAHGGLGVLRNYFKEWASIDVPVNAVEGSLCFIGILAS